VVALMGHRAYAELSRANSDQSNVAGFRDTICRERGSAVTSS